MPPTTPSPERVRSVTEREMTAFFRKLLTRAPGWPGIPQDQFVDALAASLINVDPRTGVAFAQTLVHELQDRINRKLEG